MGPTAKAGLICAMVTLMLAGQLLERELASKRKAAVEEKKRAPAPYAALLAPLADGELPKPPRPDALSQREVPASDPIDAGRAAAPPALVTNASGEVVYVVQQGDTLARIARRFFGTEGALDLIEKRNRKALPDPAKLQVGMTLHIPSRDRLPAR